MLTAHQIEILARLRRYDDALKKHLQELAEAFPNATMQDVLDMAKIRRPKTPLP